MRFTVSTICSGFTLSGRASTVASPAGMSFDGQYARYLLERLLDRVAAFLSDEVSYLQDEDVPFLRLQQGRH